MNFELLNLEFLNSQNLIIIFTRNPELGKVKTRLAKTIGNESALKVYKFLLQHTEKTIRNLNADKVVYYSVAIRENDIWDNSIYQKQLQKGNNLGERMCNAFKDGFKKGYKNIVIVGSDLLDLKPSHINSAFQKLQKNNVVIGPAKDGGYYLLGMKKLHKSIFQNKKWGTETVRKDTLNDLKNESLTLLEMLNDIDTFDDMKHYETLKHLYKNP